MRNPLHVVAAVLTTVAAGCATSGPERVDPYDLHLEAGISSSTAPRGFMKGSGESGGRTIPGDPVTFDEDVELTGDLGTSASAEARVGPDQDVRLSYARLGLFEGHENLDLGQRYAGQSYAAGEHTHGGLEWTSAALSLGQRVASLRGGGVPDTDLAVRVGVQRDAFHTSTDNHHGKLARRYLIGVAPFVGIESRTALTDSTTLIVGADGGYWSHDDRRTATSDVGFGVRQQVLGPVEAVLTYALVRRDTTFRRSDTRRDQVRAAVHVVTVGLGLSF